MKMAPKQLKLYQNLGYLLSLNSSRLNEALVWFKKAIKINPDADAYMNTASVLLKLNRTSEAIPYLEKTVEYNSHHAAQALHTLAYAHTKQGEKELAVQYCRKALSVDENYVPAIITLANELQKTGEESNLKEARQL